MNVCGIVYAMFYLKEVPQRGEVELQTAEIELMNTVEFQKNQHEPLAERRVRCSEIFNFQILRDSLNVVFRKREYNGRTVVLLLFLMTIVYNGIFAGETVDHIKKRVGANLKRKKNIFFRRKFEQLLLRSNEIELGSYGGSSLCSI